MIFGEKYDYTMEFKCGTRIRVDLHERLTWSERLFDSFESWHEGRCDCERGPEEEIES